MDVRCSTTILTREERLKGDNTVRIRLLEAPSVGGVKIMFMILGCNPGVCARDISVWKDLLLLRSHMLRELINLR